MHAKAMKLLRIIGGTENCSSRLPKRSIKYANELIEDGLAVIILNSWGPAELALTSKGVELLEQEESKEE
jgi:hypothetical protein